MHVAYTLPTGNSCCALQRKQRGYLTVEEEEDYALEQQQHQKRRFSHLAATAAPGAATSRRSNMEAGSRAPTKPGTAAALPVNTTTTPGRARDTAHPVRTSPSPSRRPVTRAAKPREVVVSKDYSLGRHPPPILGVTAAAPGAKGGACSGGGHAPGGTKAAGGGGRGGFRGSKAISVQTRGGGEAVVMVPKRPRPIWFAGSGAIQAEWSALPGGARVVRDLEGLEEQGRRVLQPLPSPTEW